MCQEPRVLILGTIPGKNSISANEYYYDNSNRMWKMLAKLATQKMPTNYTEKKVLLEYLHVVLWDYYQFVERNNSTDKGILKGIPNDIVGFVRKNPTITKIAINGYGNTISLEKNYKISSDSLSKCFVCQKQAVSTLLGL